MTQIYTQHEVIEERLDDVICNRCKLSCRTAMGTIEALPFHATWGYGSEHDCELWEGDLCAVCAELFKEWIESFNGEIDITECTVDGTPLGTPVEVFGIVQNG